MKSEGIDANPATCLDIAKPIMGQLLASAKWAKLDPESFHPPQSEWTLFNLIYSALKVRCMYVGGAG